MNLNNIPVGKKVGILVVVSLVAMLLISFLIMSEFRHTLFLDRQDKVRSVVEVAHSEVQWLISRYKEGELSEEMAKAKAMNIIENMRYDGDNYLWINDMKPVMIMHPFSKQLIGKDLSGNKDANGKALFVEMTQVVEKEGAGFVDYMWVRPGDEKDHPVPKVSYVVGVPEWGWVVGSGLYVDDVDAEFFRSLVKVVFIVGILAVVTSCLSYLIYRNISLPLGRITNNLSVMAEDKKAYIVDADRKDEIGLMANSLNALDIKLEEARQMHREQELAAQKAEEEKKKYMHDLANSFENRVQSIIQTVSSAAVELTQTAEHMDAAVSRSSDMIKGSTAEASETSDNVNTVASAAEEMSASVKEISSQVHRTNELVSRAVDKIDGTDTHARSLDEASAKVKEVVGLIADISNQVNLLALNATIEAARAGEAGKGFAVVAGEVKNLANQTDMSISEIEKVIGEMGVASTDIINSLKEIKSSVSEISSSTGGIASAVEEQSSTTDDIALNIQYAARNTQSVSNNLGNIQNESEITQSSSTQVLQSAQELSRLSENLDREVAEFLSEIRHG